MLLIAVIGWSLRLSDNWLFANDCPDRKTQESIDSNLATCFSSVINFPLTISAIRGMYKLHFDLDNELVILRMSSFPIENSREFVLIRAPRSTAKFAARLWRGDTEWILVFVSRRTMLTLCDTRFDTRTLYIHKDACHVVTIFLRRVILRIFHSDRPS